MYQKYFGLNYQPFHLSPRIETVYLSSQHKEALSVLEYSMYEGGSGSTVVTGGVGSGKTTVLNFLLNRLGSKQINCGVVSNTHPSTQSIFDYITLGFDIGVERSNVFGREAKVLHHLRSMRDQGYKNILFIDEAQNLSVTVLEQFRLFMNSHWSNGELLNIVLLGQPELLQTFKNPAMKPFVQRIAFEAHITPLSLKQTIIYIRFLLRRAGVRLELFSLAAYRTIHLLSGGAPRAINALCDHAMLVAYKENSKFINSAMIVTAVSRRPIVGSQYEAWRLADKYGEHKLASLSGVCSGSAPQLA